MNRYMSMSMQISGYEYECEREFKCQPAWKYWNENERVGMSIMNVIINIIINLEYKLYLVNYTCT